MNWHLIVDPVRDIYKPNPFLLNLVNAIKEEVGTLCYERGPDGWVFNAKEYKDLSIGRQRQVAVKEFTLTCQALDAATDYPQAALLGGMMPEFFNEYGAELGQFAMLASKLVSMVLGVPIAGLFTTMGAYPGNTGRARFVAILAQHAWFLKYVSRFMNEHALMVASFFRVNAKRLRASEPLLTDVKAFARQCKEDIADGPNPPPPPPTAEEIAAARADAEAQRQRTEERDPLMDGIDYPPSIGASACE